MLEKKVAETIIINNFKWMESIWTMAKEGKWEGTTESLTSQLSQRDSEGKNPLHTAAMHGQLGKVPKELLKPQIICQKDLGGKTVLHYAILDKRNGFENIPAELLNEKNLLLKDINNNSIYHILAYSKDIDKLEKKLLKEEYLTEENTLGIMPIEYVTMGQGSLLKFFKSAIKGFKTQTIIALKQRILTRGEFLSAIEKELKTREITQELAKHDKRLEIS